MKKTLPLLILFLGFYVTQGFGCVCVDLTKEDIKAMFKESDFVVIGKAISNVDSDSGFKDLMDKEEKESEVIFEVDSVLKGDLIKKEKIFILQNAGSCTRTFYFGNSYIIFGQEVKVVKDANENNEKVKDGEIPPLRPVGLENGVMEIYAGKRTVKYLNRQIRKRKTISTDLCMTFKEDKKSYSDVKDALKN